MLFDSPTTALKYMIGGVMGLILLIALYYSAYPLPPASFAQWLENPSSSALSKTVLYTSSGFSPRSLAVPIDTRIIFKNTATGTPMWVASDPYPSSTDYPAFNSRISDVSGQSYVFEFTQTGTFGYHNQEVPIDDGTVTVYDPKHPLPDISKTQSRQQAVRDKLLALFIPNDPNSVFSVIDHIEADPSLSLDCHDVGHDLGHKAYELYGFSGAMTFNNPGRENHVSAMDICAGAYVHGILEEASLHDPSFTKNPGDLCKNVPSQNIDSCYHGVGHALMFSYRRNIQDSLSGCRTIASAAGASRCFEGVWMETFWGNTEHSGPDTLSWDLNKPLDPCINSNADAKSACFIYSSFGYLRSHVHDYSGAIKLCTTSDLDSSDTSSCLKGVGIALTSHLREKNLEQSEPYAAVLTSPEKLSFYEGVMGYGRFSGLIESDLNSACWLMQTDTAICTEAVQKSR